ncbi:MAG: TrmH family RNA methyltransferase [Acidimicrobiales bacterium]
MKPLGSTDLKRLHRTWRRRTPGRVGLLLDSVQTPFNVGAIVRSAAAWRVDDVWLVGATPGLDNSKVQKTAMGTDRFLEVHQPATAADAVAAIQTKGYRLIGIELATNAEPLHELDLAGDICLAVGHEDRGVTGSVLDQCEAVAFIPQLGRVGSLNVATAAAIAIYEARRQAWTS